MAWPWRCPKTSFAAARKRPSIAASGKKGLPRRTIRPASSSGTHMSNIGGWILRFAFLCTSFSAPLSPSLCTLHAAVCSVSTNQHSPPQLLHATFGYDCDFHISRAADSAGLYLLSSLLERARQKRRDTRNALLPDGLLKLERAARVTGRCAAVQHLVSFERDRIVLIAAHESTRLD